MKYGKGTDLPGMPPSQGAQIGVIYVSPDDDRKTVVTAILAQDKFEREQKREQIVLDLPQKNKAFQHPEDFDYLKTVRRRLRAKLIIVTLAGRGPGEFARQRQFTVFSTMESFVHSYITDNSNQSDQSTPAGSPPNNKPDKRGAPVGTRKAAAAGAAGIAAEGVARARAARNAPPQRRQPGPRPFSGLTPVGEIPDLPTREQPIEPTPPQTPRPQISAEDEDEDRGFLPPSIVDADTVEQEHDDDQQASTPGGAATFGAGWPGDDDARHTPSPSQGAGPGSNIESDDDWEALPPLPGQSVPAKLPNTPAAMSTDTASKKMPSRPLRTPTPIVLGAAPPMSPRTGKPTKILPDSAGVGVAEPASVPTTPPPTTPNHNADQIVAAGAGAAVGGALSGTGTGKTPAAPSRPTPNTGKTPVRNAGAARPAGPAGSISAISTGWPPRISNRASGPRGARTANRRKWPILLIALLILLTLFVVGALTISANPKLLSFVAPPPPATVTITPASKTVQETYIIQGVTSNANAENRQVTARQLTSTKTATDTVTATGHAQIAAVAATGMLDFTSAFSNEYDLAAGTSFGGPNGITVITDALVKIPPVDLNTGTVGRASVPAHVSPRGAIGNIAAGTLNQTCCVSGNEILAKNEAFSGGVDAKNYAFLQAGDVNAVTNAHQATLKSDAQNEIQTQIKSGEQLLGQTNCNDPQTTADVQVGDHGVNVTTAHVTVSVTCNAEVYDANAVQTIAQNALKQKVSKDPTLGGYVLADNLTITQAQPPQAQQDGSITFSVQASGLWYYNWTDANKQALLKKIEGMSKAQAQALLKSMAGIGNATIAINNGGTTLPTDGNQITLKINQPTGPSGGSNQTPTQAGSTPTH